MAQLHVTHNGLLYVVAPRPTEDFIKAYAVGDDGLPFVEIVDVELVPR